MSHQISALAANAPWLQKILQISEQSPQQAKVVEEFCDLAVPMLEKRVLSELETCITNVTKLKRKFLIEHNELAHQKTMLNARIKVAYKTIDLAYPKKLARFVQRVCLKRVYNEVCSEIDARTEQLRKLSPHFDSKYIALMTLHEQLAGKEQSTLFYKQLEDEVYGNAKPPVPIAERNPQAQLVCKKATLHLARTYQNARDAYYAEKEAREKKQA